MGQYQVVVTTSSGSVTSGPAALIVLTPPQVLADPTSVVARSQDIAQFSVSAAGTPPLSYQWFFNGSLVANATNSALRLQATTGGDVFVIVSNQYGAATSSVARLEGT